MHTQCSWKHIPSKALAAKSSERHKDKEKSASNNYWLSFSSQQPEHAETGQEETRRHHTQPTPAPNPGQQGETIPTPANRSASPRHSHHWLGQPRASATRFKTESTFKAKTQPRHLNHPALQTASLPLQAFSHSLCISSGIALAAEGFSTYADTHSVRGREPSFGIEDFCSRSLALPMLAWFTNISDPYA